MKHPERIPMLLVLWLIAGVALASAEYDGPRPWFVRTIVDTEEPICEEATLVLTLEDQWSEILSEITVPLEENDWTDRSWKVAWSAGHSYVVTANVTTCSGLRVGNARVSFDVSQHELDRQFYVGVGYHKAQPHLTLLETNVTFTDVLSAVETDDAIIVKNDSEYSIHRCANPLIDRVDREFLVDGEWGQFNWRVTYSWPQNLNELQPGASMTIEPPRVHSFHHDPKARRVKPTRQRFKLFGEPNEAHRQILGRPEEIPAGLPGCDRYYVEAAVTDSSPSVEVVPE